MLLTHFRETLGRYARLLLMAFSGRHGLAGVSFRHYAVTVPLLALLPLYLAYHWFGLLLDEVLFRDYRRVQIVRPLFIVGVPRSGTSALHATLADDPRFTTFRTWECLFAVSVTWRRFWWAVAAVDRLIGRPGARLLAAAERRAFQRLDGTHPMRLDSPEEDYFVFLPLLYCFVLIAAFPDAPWLWRFGRFDRAMAEGERHRLMTYYRRCVQRHLYAHGTQRGYLSKNPTFSPLVATLLETFPDARVICCLRDPVEAVSSQLSVMDGPMRAIHGGYDKAIFQHRLSDQLAFYYEHLLDVLRAAPPKQAVFVPAPALRLDLRETVTRIYTALELPLDAEFASGLRRRGARARAKASAHRHDLSDTTVTRGSLYRRLSTIYRVFDFRAVQPVVAAQLNDHTRCSA